MMPFLQLSAWVATLAGMATALIQAASEHVSYGALFGVLCTAITALFGTVTWILKRSQDNESRRTDLLERAQEALEREQEARDKNDAAMREWIRGVSVQLERIMERLPKA